MLLLGGFHAMVDDVVGELTAVGTPACGPRTSSPCAPSTAVPRPPRSWGAASASASRRRRRRSPRSEALGYVDREADLGDARRKRLRVTARGHEMMTIGSELFEEVRERWAAQVGAAELDRLQAQLGSLVTLRPLTADDLARDAD